MRPTSSSRGSACAAEGLQHSNAEARQGQADHAAEARQHETLDQELPREPRPAGAQRGANRELVHAAGRPHQREVGDVHARHEQDEPDGGEHQVQRTSRARDELFVQRHRDNRALLRGRPAFPHGRRQRGQLRLGLFQRDAVAQPADGRQRVVLFVGVPGESVRDPRRDIRGNRILEAGRRDARHFIGFGAQSNRGADDRRVAAEVRSPDRVTEHDTARAGLVVAVEAAAKAGCERSVLK